MAAVPSLSPGPSPNAHASSERRLRATRDIAELDDPFEEHDPLYRDFVAYLRSQRIPEIFLGAFEAEARALSHRFANVKTEALDAERLAVHLQEGHRAALSERALRNRAVAGKAFLDFLRVRERRRQPEPPRAPAPALPLAERRPSPPPPPPPKDTPPSEKRRYRRVPFLADVRVDDFGLLRSADLSTGGMYLEKLTMVTRGTFVRLHFKLYSSDPETISVTARVTFVHPQFGAGLDFVEIRHDDRRRIASFVDRVA